MATAINSNLLPAVFITAPFEAGQNKLGPSQAPSQLLEALQSSTSQQEGGVAFHVAGINDSLIRELEQEHPPEMKAGILNFELVSAFNEKLYEEVKRLASTHRVITLGGDHSIAIGSIAGVCSAYPGLKVVWIDAHADINTLSATLSGKLHGCPVSFLMGLGNSRMPWLQPCLKPSDLIYLGLRDVEPQEAALMQEQLIAACDMREVEENGIQAAITRILDFVGNAPVHVSLDVDGLDPEFMGATGTPVAGGLTFDDVKDVLQALKNRNLVSMDVVEVNPLEGSERDRLNTIHYSNRLISMFLSP